jgi:guanylate kinase
LAFCVCGPSGAGKTTVIREVMGALPGLAFSVSHTSRSRRANETEGEDYWFVSREAFEALIEAGELVEHVTYAGEYYGTSRAEVETVFARGEDLLLNLDVQGAQTLQASELAPGAQVVYVFLAPSSPERLAERLRQRGTEDEQRIRLRLEAAAEEMKLLPRFDYLVINDRFRDAVDELRAIIVAERCRVR